MILPPDFIFSQNNLQAYIDCPRRFELAFIQRLRWPAVQVEPVLEHERHIELGKRFHRLVFQQRQGLPAEVLTASINEPDLHKWWESYLKYAPAGLPENQRAEFGLSMPFSDFRLMARYDLLALEKAKQAVIVDWKTTIKKPRAADLGARIQTRLYPFVLANCNDETAGTPPENISLVYWFPNFPAEPEAFTYSGEKLKADREFFASLIEKIIQTPGGGFALTDDPRACTFCAYRSLCGRGQAAGRLESFDDDPMESGSLFDRIDLENIDGISF